jgi:putative tricarboxylic transport membrane protein
MELLSNLALGFSTAASPENLLFCLIGVILGTLIGVLPGIGATATIAMLLPITFQLEPVSSLIMLAGIYYGAQYGGSTTAILINMPGQRWRSRRWARFSQERSLRFLSQSSRHR